MRIAFDLSKGDVVDAGAWIGPYTLLMAQNAKRVFSFEPDAAAFEELTANLRANHIKNVSAFKMALSATTGTYELYSKKLGGSESSMVKKEGASISVPTITLDEACLEYGIRPTFIKIDVEGAEGLVLGGAQRIISSYKPTIMLEYHKKFMSQAEHEENWSIITKNATSVKEIRKEDKIYTLLTSYG